MLKLFIKYHLLMIQHKLIKKIAKPNFETETINDNLGYSIYYLFKYKGSFNGIFTHKTPCKKIEWYYYHKQKHINFNL